MDNNKFSFTIEGILYEGTLLPPFQALKWGPKVQPQLDKGDKADVVDVLFEKTIITATDPNSGEKFKMASSEEFNIWFSSRRPAMFRFVDKLIEAHLTPFLS